jgi:hypothetical protein
MAAKISAASQFRNAAALISRFPFPFLVSSIAIVLYWRIFDEAALPRSNFDVGLIGLLPFFVSAFLVTFAAALLGETAGQKLGTLAAIGGLAAVAAFHHVGHWVSLLFTPGLYQGKGATSTALLPSEFGLSASWLFLIGGLLLLLLVAPFATKQRDPGAFWQFAHKFFVASLAAAVGAWLAYGGVFAVLKTFELLFEVGIPWEVLAKTLVITSFAVGPAIWLALTPSDFEDLPKRGKEMEFTSRAVLLLVRYIFMPVAFALSLLLAAYIVKVALTGSFGTARLGLRGLLYGAGIVAVALLSFPEREDRGTARFFWRVWPLLIIPPTFLALVSLKFRIEEYGWSIFRYFALLVGLWLVIVIAANLVRSRNDIRPIPASLAILLLLASIGPWGALNVTGRSQAERLIGFLNQNGLLRDGKWAAESAPGWSQTELTTMRSFISELENARQLYRLAGLFEGTADNPFAKSDVAAALRARMGIDYWFPARKPGDPAPFARPYFHFDAPSYPIVIQVGQSWLVGPFTLLRETAKFKVCFPAGCAEFKQNRLDIEMTVTGNEAGAAPRTVHFDLTQILGSDPGEAMKKSQTISAKEAQTISGGGDFPATLKVVSLNLNLGTSAEVVSGQYYAVVPQF